MPKIKELFINISILLLTLLFCFAILEGILHLAIPSPKLAFKNVREPNPYLGASNKPNMSTIAVGRDYKANVTINRCGIRDENINGCFFKSNNSYKIIVLGDSFTFGMGVNNNETYPYFMEKILNNKSSNRSYEVSNAGVIAYGSSQEVMYLSELFNKTYADLVIIGFYSNDITDVYNFKSQSNDSDTGKNNFQFIKTFLRANTRTYPFFVNLLVSNRNIRLFLAQKGWIIKRTMEDFLIFGEEYPPFFQNAISETEKWFLQARDLARQNNSTLLILYIPTQAQFDEKMFDDIAFYNKGIYNIQNSGKLQPNKLLANFTDKFNIWFVDPTGYFNEAYTDKRLYLPYDGHFNADGNLLIADIISEAILSKNL